jgi:hypothetical protein
MGILLSPKYTIRIWCPAEPKELIRLAYMLNMDPGRWIFFFFFAIVRSNMGVLLNVNSLDTAHVLDTGPY